MTSTNPFPQNAQVLMPVPLEQLAELIQQTVRKEIRAKQEEELLEKFLSPEQTCNLFNPKISRVTLDSWSDKGYLNKIQLGGRIFYKYSEVIDSINSNTLKRYNRSLPQ